MNPRDSLQERVALKIRPCAAAIALVAMAVAALAALASMIWIVAIFAFFGFRTRGIRRRSRRHLDDQRMYVHVRRYGRF